MPLQAQYVALSVAIQTDGKIVAAGYGFNGTNDDFELARYNADGTLDDTFNGTGKIITPIGGSNDGADSVAIQTDGKIVAAGYSFNGSNWDFALARYDANGTLDTMFNGTGKVVTPIGSDIDVAASVAIQTDGKIVAAGRSINGSNYDFALVRYNTDGSLDTSSFGTGGKVVTPIGGGNDVADSVAIQTDGKIVAAGYSFNGTNEDFALARYNTNGTLDIAFNGTGKVVTPIGSGDDVASSVVIQADGKIVAAGEGNGSNLDFALVRYNTDGTLDTSSFGTGGKVVTPIGSSTDAATSIALQTDGRIVAAGYSYSSANLYDFAVARYNTNGTLDTTFYAPGHVVTPIGSGDDFGQSVAIQTDGKIVAAGWSYSGSNYHFALARYNTNGSLDTSFGSGGSVVTPIGTSDDIAYSVAIQTDGKIVAAGLSYNPSHDADFALVRYDTDGSLDTSSFGTGGKVVTPIGSGDDEAASVAIQTNGEIVAAGYSRNGSTDDFALARYLANGTLDATFNGTGKVVTPIGSGAAATSVAVQTNDRIVAAGYTFNGSNNDFALVRYNTNGTLDTTFGGTGKVVTAIGSGYEAAFSVALQTDGGIVAAGYTNNGANNDFALVRYHGNACATTASISGTVTYGNAAAPPKYISNATVTGAGSPTVMTTTAAPGGTAGQYILTGFGAGSYTVSLSKTAGQNSITSNDAARIAQHVSGTLLLTNDNQKVTADVSGNGVVSSNDAALIARYVTSLGAPIGNTGQWRFYLPPGPTFPVGSSPTSRTYASVTNNLTGEDYIGLLIGEVTGNWVPGSARPSGGGDEPPRQPQNTRLPPLLNQGGELSGGPERGIAVDLPNVVMPVGNEIVVPVNVQGIANKGIISYEFDLRYDPSVIQPTGDVVDVAWTVSQGLSVVRNASEPGRLRVAVYGPMPIDQDGVLLELKFTAVGKAGSMSPLTFERIMFNEGELRVAATEGNIELP